MNNWPFIDSRNVATFTIRQIVKDGQPILLVSHDSDDGAWQFLSDSAPETSDFMIVSLEEMVNLDRSLVEIADLPLGWQARRMGSGQPWSRFVSPNA